MWMPQLSPMLGVMVFILINFSFITVMMSASSLLLTSSNPCSTNKKKENFTILIKTYLFSVKDMMSGMGKKGKI